MAATDWNAFTDQTNARMAALRKEMPDVAPAFGSLAKAAIAPGDSEFTGSVYRFDREAGVVHRVAVRVDGVRDNLVIVTEGLEPGDIVASAGVSFLMDGQAVRLLEE